MHVSTYNKVYQEVFNSSETQDLIKQSVELVDKVSRIFFIGNGGSNSIASHMMEDYGKMGRKKTFAFSDPALITCYANDYGYENAMKEWLDLHLEPGDLLVAISSSGNSMNIVNAAQVAKEKGGLVLTCSGFGADNKLRQLGDLNFYLPSTSYGVVECFHQVFLHVVLDDFCEV